MIEVLILPPAKLISEIIFSCQQVLDICLHALLFKKNNQKGAVFYNYLKIWTGSSEVLYTES